MPRGAWKGHRQRVGQSLGQGSMEHEQIADFGGELLPEPIAERRHTLPGLVEALGGEARSPPQTDDAGYVFGSRAESRFVPGAVLGWLELDAPANVEGSNPLGGIRFVPGYRQEIYLQLIDQRADFADALGRVGV